MSTKVESSMMNYKQMHELGYKIFALHSLMEDGRCTCLEHVEDPERTCEALYKHPRSKNWQKTPLWSSQQIKNMEEELKWFETGYGVLVDGLLVVDVDARNGGVDSLYQLQDDLDIDLEALSGYVVETGSGEGSRHIYFKLDKSNEHLALMQSHKDYEGIDFKSSGFVVGAGSKHTSGNPYRVVKGSPEIISSAPPELLEVITRPIYTRGKFEGATIDFTDQELHDLVMKIPNDRRDYEYWIRIGMAINNATNGGNDGYDLWVAWSSSNPAHDESEMEKKWHSFGKSSNPATLGTLVYLAKENGYTFPKKWNINDLPVGAFEPTEDLLDINHIDIRRPMGFAGELTQWVNDQCLYPRENLAAAAALFILSACGGMRHEDELNGLTPNIIAFCISGSGTGKDAILKSINDCLEKVGISQALHGGIKSEQEILRNLIRHQAALYSIDELGLQLQKVVKAMKRGGATYLEGVFAQIMSAYSRADGSLNITGDLKEEIKEGILKEIAKVNREIDAGRGNDKTDEQLNDLIESLAVTDTGIKNPYLTIFGGTTAVTFDELVDFEMATNGFIARAVIFRESDTNPRRKERFRKAPMNNTISQKLMSLYWGSNAHNGMRVEQQGAKVQIATDPLAEKALDAAYEYFYNKADEAKEHTGLEAIPRRGWEICSKISLLLGMADGYRTLEHVRYGFAVAQEDIDYKIQLAYSSMNKDDKELGGNAMVARIQTYLSKDDEVTFGVLRNKMRGTTKDELEAALELMKKNNLVNIEERKNQKGRDTVYIRAK